MEEETRAPLIPTEETTTIITTATTRADKVLLA